MKNKKQKASFLSIFSVVLASLFIFQQGNPVLFANDGIDSIFQDTQENKNPQSGDSTADPLESISNSSSVSIPFSNSPASTEITPQTSTPENQISNQSTKRLEFLETVKKELQEAQHDYHSISSNTHDAEEKLHELTDQALTLETQLKNLTKQAEITAQLIENVLSQIAEKENNLKVYKQELEIKNIEMQNQKNMLMEYLKVLYSQENSMYNTTSGNSELNIAKLLLSDKPVGEILQEVKYFKILEENGRQIYLRLEELSKEQIVQQARVEDTRQKLTGLYAKLEEEQRNLEIQREAKAKLLEETKGQEKIYQQLLEESKLEEAQTLQDISALRGNLEFIQEKIKELGDKFNPEDYKHLLNVETISVYDYIRDTENDGVMLDWPVSPSRGISAYFRDGAYKNFFGVAHNAIDIRVPQGTPIKSPADGVVYKTRDNGYGYSYIIVAHAGGIMTLYGHVSEMRVIEGEKVSRGQVIGLSGATPGTKGAGLMTTGPHLHFEVFKGGKHVDPLDYMQLSTLPMSTLPEKYLNRVIGEPIQLPQNKVKRSTD